MVIGEDGVVVETASGEEVLVEAGVAISEDGTDMVVVRWFW